MSSYTIGKLASEAGVATSTLRYYERAKLLRPEGRSSGNYRMYGLAALDCVRFIRAAQANGFTLEDIATLLRFRGGATNRCKTVQRLIEDRLVDLERRLQQLHEVKAVLQSSLKLCRKHDRTGRCQVIDTLKQAATSVPTNARRRSIS